MNAGRGDERFAMKTAKGLLTVSPECIGENIFGLDEYTIA
jgi:hypothetical protein